MSWKMAVEEEEAGWKEVTKKREDRGQKRKEERNDSKREKKGLEGGEHWEREKEKEK